MDKIICSCIHKILEKYKILMDGCNKRLPFTQNITTITSHIHKVTNATCYKHQICF